jgi:uncharacterized protein
MKKGFYIIIICLLTTIASNSPISFALNPGEISTGNVSIDYRNVTVYAPAVAQTDDGYIGVTSTITVTLQSNGSGRVFVDTLPLTQIDMQGSARLAVKVASSLVKNDNTCEINPSVYDYFFVIRTSAPIIGGPSAGGIMTAAVVSLLENWTMDEDTMMTGMINPDGSIGPIGGIPQKIDAAYSVGAKRFLIPKGQGQYLETITETVSEGGWTQITTKQVLRNVYDYAMDNYGIEVIEVEDINEVITYFTGWSFPIIETNESITTEDYLNSMEPLATSLLNDSKDSYINASESFNNTSIPNQFPYYYRNRLTDFLNTAQQTLLESEDWFNDGVFYTSTSKSFQSLINSNFVIYACEYFSSEDMNDYVNSLLQYAKNLNDNKSDFSKNAEIQGAISLQCVGAAQKRASEADLYIADANMNYQQGDYFEALQDIAFAIQRSESVGWWIGISDYFDDTGEIGEEDLDSLAEEYIDDAQQSLVYSNIILEEVGKTSSYIIEAESLLETARDDKDGGYPAAAIFEALEALANANLALELVDGNGLEKLDRYQERASSSISESRLRGIEPVLAVSYYEYAQSLENESSIEAAIFYYKYSGLIPGVLTVTSTCGGQSSRYIGIPDINVNPFIDSIIRYSQYFLFFAAIGGVLGVLVGILIGNLFGSGRKKKLIEKSLPEESSNYYSYNKRYTNYYETDDIPRSIKDYFKENKPR